MNSEPRTVQISVDNYHSAIETFLRSMKEIRNEENVKIECDWETPRHGHTVLVKITPTQEVKGNVDHTVH